MKSDGDSGQLAQGRRAIAIGIALACAALLLIGLSLGRAFRVGRTGSGHGLPLRRHASGATPNSQFPTPKKLAIATPDLLGSWEVFVYRGSEQKITSSGVFLCFLFIF